ncbi:hypothetical protein QQX98_012462 [Neonectria punicea]|uniref:Uncharacterized protein n=1 Tax=Neonectria punicea TaxID=979145 RepID=A0ABR1GJ64_9HYPO
MKPVVANVALAVVWLLLFRYCQNHSFYDPSSFFHDPTRAYAQTYSAVRETESDKFLIKAASTPATAAQPWIYEGKNVEYDETEKPQGLSLCIGIPSIRRDREQFVGRTVASLVDSLKPEQRRRVNLKVLLADDIPQQNPAYGEAWLHNIADEVFVYGNDQPAVDGYRQITNTSLRWAFEDPRNKRVQMDYANLIASCKDEGSDYFVLVEDDVITSRDWFERLISSIEKVEAQSTVQDWLYLRLFYTEVYLGWNSEEWAYYLGNSILIYLAVVGTVLFWRWKSPAMRHLKAVDLVKSNSVLVYTMTAWLAAYIGLYFMAGRLLVSPWRVGVHEMPKYGCCAQGLAMPHRNLAMLEQSLRQPPYKLAGDSFIDMVADREGLKKWAIVPSVLQHIGIRCSSDKGYLKTTWNFSFEKEPWQ